MPEVSMMSPTGTPGAGAAAAPANAGQPAGESNAGNGGAGSQAQNGGDDWQSKFSELESRYKESSAEGIRLSKEMKAHQEAVIAEKARAAALEKELAEINEIARGANPQGYDAHQMRKQYDGLSKELASIKEGQALDAFVAANPDAAQHREALRDLGRTFTGREYGDLWNTHFSAVVAANKVLAEQKRSQSGAAPETGSGTSTGEPAGTGRIAGHTLEQFNKLSLADRKAALKKAGIHEMPVSGEF